MPLESARPRLLPGRTFPPYAYLPGKFPHPVRHPLGHSYDPGLAPPPGAEPLDLEAFRWGMDLFNHGYYWEAHEAWEPLWRAAHRNDDDRKLLKGLILMAAAGVKYRERKAVAARRHSRRAAALFRGIMARSGSLMGRALGVGLKTLADHVEAIMSPMQTFSPSVDDTQVVFPFLLGASEYVTPVDIVEVTRD